MQRLHNVDKWFEVAAGKAVNFASAEPRKVRLDVNSEGVSNLFYADGNGVVTFLAAVQGRDVIEFSSTGEFSIQVEGDDCWMYSIDGEVISFVIEDAVKLTKLIERRPRDPALELMQYQMRRNMDERMQQIRDEMERSFDRRLAAAIAPTQKPKAAGDGDRVSAKSTSDKPADVGGIDKPVDAGTGEPAE